MPFTSQIHSRRSRLLGNNGKGKVNPLQAQRVGRGIALFFHDRGTRRG